MTGASPPYRVLVPTDFSDCSRRALERALEIARLRGGRVELLHVLDTSELTPREGALYRTIEEALEVLRTEARRRLEEAVVVFDPDRRTIDRSELREGAPVEAILAHAAAHGPDVIVMGTHGRTGIARHYIASVSERVVRRAACDVLVVRGDGREADAAGAT